MNPKAMVLSFLGALLLVIYGANYDTYAGTYSGTKGREKAAEPVKMAPNFSLKRIDGGSVRLEDLKGKVVILNFFATWCPPCRQEIPDLVLLHGKYQKLGLEIIGISLDIGEVDMVKAFAKRFQIKYPVVEATNQVVTDYGDVRGIPTSFIIDRKGAIVEQLVGFHPIASLERAVKGLL